MHFKNISDANADLMFRVIELKQEVFTEICYTVGNEWKPIGAWKSGKTIGKKSLKHAIYK